MSDAVIIALIGSISTTVGIIITGFINSKQNKKITGSVEQYHEEVNSKVTTLLETKDDLSKTKEELAGIKGEVAGAAEKEKELKKKSK